MVPNMNKQCMLKGLNKKYHGVYLIGGKSILVDKVYTLNTNERLQCLRKAGFQLFEVFPSGKTLRLNGTNYNTINQEPETSDTVTPPVIKPYTASEAAAIAETAYDAAPVEDTPDVASTPTEKPYSAMTKSEKKRYRAAQAAAEHAAQEADQVEESKKEESATTESDAPAETVAPVQE